MSSVKMETTEIETVLKKKMSSIWNLSEESYPLGHLELRQGLN